MPGSRWGSFVADAEAAHVIHEAGNPAHRCRVEHDATTLLVHLSGEDGDGWTALAVDRAIRRWAVGQARTAARGRHPWGGPAARRGRGGPAGVTP